MPPSPAVLNYVCSVFSLDNKSSVGSSKKLSRSVSNSNDLEKVLACIQENGQKVLAELEETLRQTVHDNGARVVGLEAELTSNNAAALKAHVRYFSFVLPSITVIQNITAGAPLLVKTVLQEGYAGIHILPEI